MGWFETVTVNVNFLYQHNIALNHILPSNAMDNVSATCTHLDLSQTEPKKVTNVRKAGEKRNNEQKPFSGF